MPSYDFACNACKLVFEATTPYDASGEYPAVKCSQCGSPDKIKLISGCSFRFGNPVGTDRWCDDFNGHQYRFDYNKEYVANQRKFAEQNSHVGPNPYNQINDLDASGPDLFGKVK